MNWDQEILHVLEDQALRGIISMTVKEILIHVNNSKLKLRIVDFLKSRGLNDHGDLIAVNLRLNPRLYVILQNNMYEEYVRVDEGNGLVFLDKSAKGLVENLRDEITLDDFRFLKIILAQISSGYAFPKFIEIAHFCLGR